MGLIRRIKAIPFRKTEKKEVCYLSREEIDVLLQACDVVTVVGRRDYLMILLLYNSGMRISEMLSLRGRDAQVIGNSQGYLRIMGKGRKERTVPLWQNTIKSLTAFMEEHDIQDQDFLLSGRNVPHLTRSGARYRMDCIVKKATELHPQLANKTITPHVFRHSTAMSLLQAGIDISTIAIWLGHERIETTHQYMVADLKLKEKALEKLHHPESEHAGQRYRATGDLLHFLNSL